MSTDDSTLNRRDFLRALAAGAFLVGVSGCSGRAETTPAAEVETTTAAGAETTTTAGAETTTAAEIKPAPAAEIVWDQWGVPHVFAESDEAAMFGLGYAAAKARLIQMELSRRIIQGRLAELIGDVSMKSNGDSSVASDLYMRTAGFYRRAREIVAALGEEERRFLQAYADGVNRYIVENPAHFPGIIPDLVHQPELWQSEDCVACWIHLANFFTRDGLDEAKPPVESASANPVDDSAAVVKRGDVDEAWVAEVLEFARAYGYDTTPIGSDGTPGPSFSHAWVVAGSRTSTGAAALVSDPQTQVTLPNLFFEFHVRGRTLDARGIGVGGSPIIIIGWNRYVAWGMTALGGDQADLFKLSVDRGHKDQYLWDGVWKEMDVWTESVGVRGSAPVVLSIKETHLGPVVTQFLRGSIEAGEYVLHRVPLALGDVDTLRAGIAMMRSESAGEFDTALGNWCYPPVNVVFGDKNGEIGYHMTGATPIRATSPNFSSGTFQDGSGPAGEWRGFIPHELQPHVFNPEQGWLASANHRVVESWYPMQQSGTGSNGHTVRSWRLYELLEASTHGLTPEEVFALHYDDVEPARRTLIEAAVYLVDRQGAGLAAEAAEALDLLRPWLTRGAHCSASDPAYPLVYNISIMFRPKSSETSLASYGGGESGLVLFCKALKEGMAAGDVISDDARDYIENAIVQGWRACQQLYGADPALWLERFRSAVGRRRLEYMVGLDGFPTLNPELGIYYPMLSDLTGNTIFSQTSQSYTQMVSLDDVDAAMSLMPVGNSEVPQSPFYRVNTDSWARGEVHPAPLSRESVDRYRVETDVIQIID